MGASVGIGHCRILLWSGLVVSARRARRRSLSRLNRAPRVTNRAMSFGDIAAATREVIGSGPPAEARAQIKLALADGQPLPRDGPQELQLGVVMGRGDVLDIPRPPAGGVHDLDSPRPRRHLHCPHIRHLATLRPRSSAQIPLTRTENVQVTEPDLSRAPG
jgi:hypothetical protein